MASQAEGRKRGTRTVHSMELIVDEKQRYVSFSKRKKGLFTKCAYLSSMFSGAVQITAVIFSPHGKLFSFAHPSPDAVFRRYLAEVEPGNWWDDVDVDGLDLEELLRFKSSLEEVKIRVSERINGLIDDFDLDFENYDELMKILDE